MFALTLAKHYCIDKDIMIIVILVLLIRRSVNGGYRIICMCKIRLMEVDISLNLNLEIYTCIAKHFYTFATIFMVAAPIYYSLVFENEIGGHPFCAYAQISGFFHSLDQSLRCNASAESVFENLVLFV